MPPKKYNLKAFEEAINAKGCLYIEGDPRGADAVICAAPRHPDSRFCPPHRKLCSAGTRRPSDPVDE